MTLGNMRIMNMSSLSSNPENFGLEFLYRAFLQTFGLIKHRRKAINKAVLHLGAIVPQNTDGDTTC